MGTAMSGRSQAMSAVRWTGFSNVVRGVIGILQIAILARLIEKADFGLMVQAVSIVGILSILADAGVSNAIIHHRDISKKELSSLYWVNVGLGFALTVVVWLSSPWVADFFNEQRLRQVLPVFSLIFLITAIGQQVRVVAEKDMRFDGLAKLEVLAAVIGLVVAVTLAMWNWGVYALAIGTLMNAAVVSAGCWLLWGGIHRIEFRLKIGEIRKYLVFGSHVVGLNFFNGLASQGDILVFGRMFSAHNLGLYSQPREMCMRVTSVINPVLTRVGVPLISSRQKERDVIKNIYNNTILMSTSFTAPIYIAAAVMSRDAVIVFLGENWADSAAYLQAAAIWCAVRAIGNPIGSLTIGTGATKRALAAAVSVATLVAISAMTGALLFGPLGIPYALALLYAALVPSFWYFLINPITGVGFWDYHMQILRPFAATAIAALCAIAVPNPFDQSLWRLFFGCALFATAYIVASYWCNRSWITTFIELALGGLGRKKARV